MNIYTNERVMKKVKTQHHANLDFGDSSSEDRRTRGRVRLSWLVVALRSAMINPQRAIPPHHARFIRVLYKKTHVLIHVRLTRCRV